LWAILNLVGNRTGRLPFVWPQIGTVATSFQRLPVKDRDGAPSMRNEACALERLQCDGHSRALGAEHECEEFVCEGEGIAVKAITGHEQPASQTLFDLAATVGEGRLRNVDRCSALCPDAGWPR
jgi:hypothetical protein